MNPENTRTALLDWKRGNWLLTDTKAWPGAVRVVGRSEAGDPEVSSQARDRGEAFVGSDGPQVNASRFSTTEKTLHVGPQLINL
jgi:hypothetical protein